MMFKGFVYIVTNLIDNTQYVGITTDIHSRWIAHCCPSSGCRLLAEAIGLFGKECFKIETLEECDNKQLLSDRERYFIALYDTFNNGYNLTTGGQYGGLASEETKLKISESNLNRYKLMTPEERKEQAKHLSEYIKPKHPVISFNISTGDIVKFKSHFDTGFSKDLYKIIKQQGCRGNCYWYDYDSTLPDSHYIAESMERLGGRLWVENEKPIKSINIITQAETIYPTIFECFNDGFSNSAIRKCLTGVIDTTGGCRWEPVGYTIPKITRILKDRKGCTFSEEHKRKLSESAKNRKCEIKPGMRTRKEHDIIGGIPHKTCYNCKTSKYLSSYHGDNKRWDKKSDLCKTCHAQKSKENHHKRKAKLAALNLPKVASNEV